MVKTQNPQPKHWGFSIIEKRQTTSTILSNLRAMQNPLVSILIPFKNTAVFLPECIESILRQHYKNWEVLAIDDGSTDESWTIVNQFAVSDPRIKVTPIRLNTDAACMEVIPRSIA